VTGWRRSALGGGGCREDDRLTDHGIETPDGRVLQVLERGDPTGRPVLVHSGTPNSRLLFDRDVARAERQRIRLISYDRPGYGGSTVRTGRSVGDCAEDVRTIAKALGIERLGVWGISGGGPHAIACAALLSDLVPVVAVLASPAPWGAPGADDAALTRRRRGAHARCGGVLHRLRALWPRARLRWLVG